MAKYVDFEQFGFAFNLNPLDAEEGFRRGPVSKPIIP
jgi:hypothetical protein